MKIIPIEQGSAEWHRWRRGRRSASLAPVIMGESKHATRLQAIRSYHQPDEEPHPAIQRLFDRGHEAEAEAREKVEQDYGITLLPLTVADDWEYLTASLDGVDAGILETADENGNIVASHDYAGPEYAWECKLWNESKAEWIREYGTVPPEDYWQVQQQMLIVRPKKMLYTLHGGGKHLTIEVEFDPDSEDQLLKAWSEFDRSVENYVPEDEPKQITISPKELSSLPPVLARVSGQVVETNIDQVHQAAVSFFENEVLMEPATDEDFVQSEAVIKFCSALEERLADKKREVIAQMDQVNDLISKIEDIHERARTCRLALNTAVKEKKAAVRQEIYLEAVKKVNERVGDINAALGETLIAIDHDIQGAMKGKRTLQTLRDAADQAATDAIIKAQMQADRVRANLATLERLAGEYDISADIIAPDRRKMLGENREHFAAEMEKRALQHQRDAAEREAKRAAAEQAASAPAQEPGRQVEIDAKLTGTSGVDDAPAAAPVKQPPPATKPLRPVNEFDRGYIEGLKACCDERGRVHWRGARWNLDDAIQHYLAGKE